MYCPKCGKWNAEGSPECSQCRNPLSASPPQYEGYSGAGAPPNYLVWAILATLFCCLPSGIVAIIYAAQVNSKYQGGDYAGAVDASNKAKLWSWISFGVGFIVTAFYIILIAIGAAAGG